MEELLKNFSYGFITARETAIKLMDAEISEDVINCLCDSIRENYRRVKIEAGNLNPIMNEVSEILEGRNYDKETTAREYREEGVLVREYSLTIYATWTDAKATFKFDNSCAADNTANFEALKNFVENN